MVCTVLKERPEDMRELRDAYLATAGPCEWLVAEICGVDPASLHQHAWRHGWHRRRSWNRAAMERSFWLAAWARLRATWQLAGPYSADRMLELLGKSIGVGQRMKVAVEGKLAYEQLLLQSINDGPKRGAAEVDEGEEESMPLLGSEEEEGNEA